MDHSGTTRLRDELTLQRDFFASRVPVYARLLDLLPDTLAGPLGDALAAAWSERTFSAWYERPLLLLWLPPLFWAGNLVLGRALGASFPPVSLAVGRWLVALIALLPFVLGAMQRQRALLLAHWRLIFLCGAFGIAGYNALAYVALQTTPTASVAFLNSTLPLMVPVAGGA